MKNLFFAIAMMLTLVLASCQNSGPETISTSQDTTRVDSTSTKVDSVGITADSSISK